MEARPVRYSIYTDRRTDMTKLVVDFRNFANAPKSKSEIGNFPFN